MATFIIGTIVFILFLLAVSSIVKKNKNNKGGCGCNCSGCSTKELCSNKLEIRK